tara:strand:+ start:142 stop:780 length:639 start_codon:yes stop_codon:yes gene_type:complete
MKKFNYIVIFTLVLVNSVIVSKLQANINNNIIVKVGDSLVTSLDIKNEIITNLLINKKEITQENINNYKNYAVKNLINKTIKKSEINKYQIKNFNKKDLQDYIDNIAKNLNTNPNGLRKLFKNNSIDYEIFVESFRIELLWNTLIFKIYKDQTNINIVEIDNEIEKIKENKSEEELKEIKKKILDQKKQEKLSLFSRMHFSNLESSVGVNFQ